MSLSSSKKHCFFCLVKGSTRIFMERVVDFTYLDDPWVPTAQVTPPENTSWCDVFLVPHPTQAPSLEASTDCSGVSPRGSVGLRWTFRSLGHSMCRSASGLSLQVTFSRFLGAV